MALDLLLLRRLLIHSGGVQFTTTAPATAAAPTSAGRWRGRLSGLHGVSMGAFLLIGF